MPAKTEPAARPRERLTRDRVIDAALEIMDEEGIEAISMRRVARQVGVEAMSLYNHVADKEDLLDGVCARVMADFRFPEEEHDWIETMREGASEWRRVLKSHPNVLALFAERHKPMTDLDALLPMEFALRTIGRAGMSERQAVQVFNVMGGFIMGFVMMESGRMFGGGTMDKDTPSPGEMSQAIAGGQLPCVAAALPHLAACDPDEQFGFGLDLLLAGLQARYGLPA
jgi:AcrR family transcriptional regulator